VNKQSAKKPEINGVFRRRRGFFHQRKRMIWHHHPSTTNLHGDTMSSEAETKPEAEAKSVEDAKTSEDVDKAAEALGNVGVAGESPIPPIPHFFPRIVANARLPAPPPPSPSL
jgi:hypothetical protein